MSQQDSSEINRTLEEYLEFSKNATIRIEELEQENASLAEKVAKLEREKVTLTKVASGQSPIDTGKLENSLDILAATGLISESARKKAAAECAADPNRLIDVIDIISAPLAGVTGQGIGVKKEASEEDGVHESDRLWAEFSRNPR